MSKHSRWILIAIIGSIIGLFIGAGFTSLISGENILVSVRELFITQRWVGSTVNVGIYVILFSSLAAIVTEKKFGRIGFTILGGAIGGILGIIFSILILFS